jgi:rare lipoprotein A
MLKVTNPDTGQSVVVKVNDRGPFIDGRDLDLSYAAAQKVGLVAVGVKTMNVEVLNR